jgi:hypothetical protein
MFVKGVNVYVDNNCKCCRYHYYYEIPTHVRFVMREKHKFKGYFVSQDNCKLGNRRGWETTNVTKELGPDWELVST